MPTPSSTPFPSSTIPPAPRSPSYRGLRLRAVGRGWRWWLAAVTLRPVPYVTVPFVTTDEAGDVAWATGHWDRPWFLQALYDNARLDGWEDVLEGVDPAGLQVRHLYRAERYDGDELSAACGPETAGAVPYTECPLVH